MTWNARNLLSYSKNNATISYSYNADGIRRSKQSANEKIIYDYAGSTLVHEYHETSGIDIFYSYDSKGHLMMIETLQNQVLNKYYVAVNSRGDVEKIYNSSKALVAQYSYDSWGKVISVLDGNGNTPTSSTHIANLNPIRYRGYYYDSETGFYYLQSRYYDPNVQRFINSDDISVITTTVDHIIDKNLYAYCDNNPIVRKDESGFFFETIFDVLTLGLSVAEVVANPLDVGAWAGLIGDTIDLVPIVTGVGESVRGLKFVDKASDKTFEILKATDLSDDALKEIDKLEKVGDFTKSKRAEGTRIHTGFMKGTKPHKEFGDISGMRPDYYHKDDGILIELKPYNVKSMKQGVKQLKRHYNTIISCNSNSKITKIQLMLY